MYKGLNKCNSTCDTPSSFPQETFEASPCRSSARTKYVEDGKIADKASFDRNNTLATCADSEDEYDNRRTISDRFTQECQKIAQSQAMP